VMEAYERGDTGVTSALRGIKETAARMADALRAADLESVGALLADNWRHQQALDPEMCTAPMAALERALADAGSLGGKAAGAGAGGCMLFLVRDPGAAAAAARAAGAVLLPVAWAREGVRAW